MRCLVLAAFLAASLAYIGAGFAHCRSEFAAAAHEGGSRAAYLRAIHIERDATRHHFHVLFLQAGSGAMIAGNRAGVTGVYASLKLLV